MWKVIKASNFARGAAAAFALLTVVPQILPYQALDMVAGMHAVIVGWNLIAGYVGGLIGTLFRIPDIPAELVNALVIGFAIGPFWSFTIMNSEWGRYKGMGVLQNTAFGARGVIGFIEMFIWGFLITAMKPGYHLLIPAFAILIALRVVLIKIPSYRMGFMSALGFLCFVEAVYLLGSTPVQAAIRGVLCAEEDSIAPMCAPDTLAP